MKNAYKKKTQTKGSRRVSSPILSVLLLLNPSVPRFERGRGQESGGQGKGNTPPTRVSSEGGVCSVVVCVGLVEPSWAFVGL
jgi:hypothetical protein